MSNITVLFITVDKVNVGKNIYNYKDIVDSNSLEYYGQDCGIYDHKLQLAIKKNNRFHIVMRFKNNEPFSYLGYSDDISVIQKRTKPVNQYTTKEQRLKIKINIKQKNYVNLVFDPTIDGSGKYKKAVLDHFGLKDILLTLGFYSSNF
jgi:hypothetical protein